MNNWVLKTSMFSYKIKLFSRYNKALVLSAASAFLAQNDGKNKSEMDMKLPSDMQKNTETGLDRIKKLFTLSEHEEMHPDMILTINVVTTALIAGFIYGGFKEYNKAYQQFVYNNDATKFFNKNDARRKLTNYTTQALLKGGLAYGPKLAAFVGTFLLTSSTISSYRGKYGIVEHSIAGAITVSLSKFNLGIKGMFSGSITGGLAGTIVGTLLWLSTIITGKSMSNAGNYTYLISIKNIEQNTQFKEEQEEKLPF